MSLSRDGGMWECPLLQYISGPGPGDSSRAVATVQAELVDIQV